MQDLYCCKDELYLTAKLTDTVPAARFAWYDDEEDEKEGIYYPENPDDPDLELLDNEEDVAYEEISVLACPFCYHVFRYSEITVLSDEIRDELMPYYGDSWKDIALLHDVSYDFVSKCPRCSHAWNISKETLFPIESGKNHTIMQNFRIETSGSLVCVIVDAVIPILTIDEVRVQKQTYQIEFNTMSGETVEMTPTGQKRITFEQPWLVFESVFGNQENLQKTAEAIADLTGFQNPELQTLQQLCLWNRFRWVDVEIASKLLTIENLESYFSDVAPDDPRSIMVKKLIAGLGVHDCKTVRRALVEDITCIQDARVFGALCFTTMDAFRYALENHKLREFLRMDLGSENLRHFMCDLISQKSEMTALRRILSEPDGTLLRDTANYYARAKEQMTEEQCLHLLRGSIGEIHDRMLEHVRIAERSNEEIHYTAYQHERLEHSINGISFWLAKDTDELYEVGGRMHNCVATYCDEALRGNSVIVVGRDQNHIPVLCIELTSRFVLVQLKGVRNSIPEGLLGATAVEWVNSSQIIASSCEDYREILRPRKKQ